MAIGLMLPETADAGGAEFAVRAEGRGYESVWQGELWGENSFAEMAAVAERTSDVRIGTGIVNVFSRSPAVLAMGANSLDRLSDGRFVLGVGVSTPKAIEDLHGMSFEQPIRRTHEAVELVRLFTSDADSVDYDGKVFDVADFPGLSADVPVYNAALGPANRRVTARLCDGWLPNMVPYSELESAFEYVAEHAREADRGHMSPRTTTTHSKRVMRSGVQSRTSPGRPTATRTPSHRGIPTKPSVSPTRGGRETGILLGATSPPRW